MRDPEAEAKRFRMMALAFFIILLIVVYLLFDYVASSKVKEVSGIPGGGKRRNDF